MKSPIDLWQVLADELASWCHTSARLDVDYIKRRVEHEGESFLTITMPKYSKDFERSLEEGSVASGAFSSFCRSRGLPKFLSGFLRLVFDSTSGQILDEPNHDAVYAIRQLTLLFKKVELRCTEERNRLAVEQYIQVDKEVAAIQFDERELASFRRIGWTVFADVCQSAAFEVERNQLSPRHGPGATADKKAGNQKFAQNEWTLRLEEYFPYGEYVLPNWRYYKTLDDVDFLPMDRERPVKVTLVPKTMETPRVIAIEPTCMQYAQQGLMGSLVPKLESGFLGSDFIGFTDQSLNQLMAHEGSVTGTLATLDLSEASDRVSNRLVCDLFRPWSTLSGAIQACRSRSAVLPDGRIIPLEKFASMGSALCFPVEAMVFLTIVFVGIERSLGRPLTLFDIQSLRGQVRVYGDDIIVPADHVDGVRGALESFGLKVNQHKSFWSGKFRESCGGDYFDGTDVTPVRVRRSLPETPQDVEGCISWSAMGNAFHKRGLWRTAESITEHMKKVLRTYPCVPWGSNALGAHSFTGSHEHGWDDALQRPLVKAFVPNVKIPVNEISDVWALRKTLAGNWDDPTHAMHLLYSGRPSSVSIKKRWVAAH